MSDQAVTPEEISLAAAERGARWEKAMDLAFSAFESAAIKSTGSKDPREVRELGQGGLAWAQALVILDPSRLQGGDTPNARLDAARPPEAQAPQGGVK